MRFFSVSGIFAMLGIMYGLRLEGFYFIDLYLYASELQAEKQNQIKVIVEVIELHTNISH